jgi:hypothetical protein
MTVILNFIVSSVLIMLERIQSTAKDVIDALMDLIISKNIKKIIILKLLIILVVNG